MTTSQMIRNQQKTGSWSTVFPTEQVTAQQSTLFVKKLLAVAISNITYLRAAFPEHAFGDRCIEDLNLKILRNDSACPGACQVIQWVKGCFDALEKKYLRMVVMAIYKDDEQPETIVESYTFKFTYNNEDGISIFRNGSKITEAHSASETRKATIMLLRTIVVLTQTLRPLPDDAMMTMKLFYYDDITPCNYEPVGFESTNSSDFNFLSEPLSLKVGDVFTPFHAVKLRIKTDCQQFVLKDEEQDKLDEVTISEDLSSKPQVPLTTALRNESYTVRCPCGYNNDDNLMILCGHCKNWQHAICFGIRQEPDVPGLHICEICAKAEAVGCTDLGMKNLTTFELQTYCLWRKVLIICINLKKIMPHILVKKLNINLSDARDLINRLEKEGFIQPPLKGRQWKIVLKDIIETVAMKKYFYSNTAVTSTEDTHTSNFKHQTETQEEILATKTSTMSLKTEQSTDTISTKEQVDRPIRRSPRVAKHALFLVDPSAEFEISNSQDFDNTQPRSKRHKVSVASKAIIV